MKKLLMICYYFPPLGMGGTQRPAKFAKYLRKYNWQITVLTVKDIAYWAKDPSLVSNLNHVQILRTESLDPQRLLVRFTHSHDLSPAWKQSRLKTFIKEKILSFILIPDSAILWNFFAVRKAKKVLKADNFDAIFSTSPPHSVHLIAMKLSKSFNIPWVADFRDSWAGGVVVSEPTFLHRRINVYLQKKVVQAASAVIAVTPGIKSQLSEKEKNAYYIPNGFDQDDYGIISRKMDGRYIFCHSGAITRFSNPESLIQAVKWIRQNSLILNKKLLFQYVGQDTTNGMKQTLVRAGVLDYFHLIGYKKHTESLDYLVNADGLILVAVDKPNVVFIPSKVFEYMGAKKPILAITNVEDTRKLLEQYPLSYIVDPGNPVRIAKTIKEMVNKADKSMLADEFLIPYTRSEQTRKLAQILETITEDG